MRILMIVALMLTTTSCELLDVAGSIYSHTEADNDDTMEVTTPFPIAVGAEWDIVAHDACTDSADRCETDRISVATATASGVFDVSSFMDDHVTILAREAGAGTLNITADIDGSKDSVWLDLTAEPITSIHLDAKCVEGGFRWIAAGERISIPYRFSGDSGPLAGRMKLPIETTLIPVTFAEPGVAVYEAPMEAGIVPMKFGASDTNLLDLEVFRPEDALFTVLAATNLTGPTFWLDVEERVMGFVRPCIESREPITLQIGTPDVCLFEWGNTLSASQDVMAGDKVLMRTLAKGECNLSASRPSSIEAISVSFDVSP